MSIGTVTDKLRGAYVGVVSLTIFLGHGPSFPAQDELVLTVVADSAVYHPGSQVSLTVTISDVSPMVCAGPNGVGCLQRTVKVDTFAPGTIHIAELTIVGAGSVVEDRNGANAAFLDDPLQARLNSLVLIGGRHTPDFTVPTALTIPYEDVGLSGANWPMFSDVELNGWAQYTRFDPALRKNVIVDIWPFQTTLYYLYGPGTVKLKLEYHYTGPHGRWENTYTGRLTSNEVTFDLRYPS